MAEKINIRMLGSFTIEYGGAAISDRNNRMRKVWRLLAYLICNRNQLSTQEHYLSLMQGSGFSESADPNGKLKALFYRARTMLNELGENAGHDWIIRKNATYAWNDEIPVTLDVEDFERLCKQAAAAQGNERLELYREALALYKGNFLPKLDMEEWVIPISAYYHQMYLSAASECLAMLEDGNMWQEAAQLCQAALKTDPCSEELYQHLMRCRIGLGDRVGAMMAYDEMSEMLFATFGVMPSDESRAIFREASSEAEARAIPSSEVREQLKEPFGARGAMFCQYDFFRTLYQLQARSIVRSGEVIHIALFSVHGQDRSHLPRRSLDRVMDNLQELLVNNLRQGDVITRCSVSQLIIMLPQANYEDSCAVCKRLLKAFKKQYPHSPAEISFSVQPLEPHVPDAAASAK